MSEENLRSHFLRRPNVLDAFSVQTSTSQSGREVRTRDTFC